jgi:quinoprotein glucose dehydrogenase
LEQINNFNAQNLEVAWTYRNGVVPGEKYNSQLTPIFTGKYIITTSANGYLISVNPKNGKEKWRIKLKNPVARRGLTYSNNKIFVPTKQGVVAINEKDGSILKNLGKQGIFGNSLSLVAPIINKKNIFVPFNKKIESFLLNTGSVNWTFDLNGARIWSGFSFDKKSNTILAVTSNLINILGDTKKNPDYSNSLLLIDAVSGKLKCKFKDVEHDHWDLDMLGNPIVATIEDKGKQKNVVYAFSKTGNIIVVDIEKCKLAFENSFKYISADTNSDIKGQTYSPKQKKYLKPTKLLSLSYNLEEYIRYLKNDKEKIDYIKFKSRRSKHGKEYIPVSLENDLIMYGIHGGPEWPGGTLDKKNNQIIIPINKYPWIIRAFYKEKEKPLSFKINNYISELLDGEGKMIYQAKCQSCHAASKKGVYTDERYGDEYIPSLIGISLTKKFESLQNLKKFQYSHKYADNSIELKKNELSILRSYFIEYDKKLKQNNLLEVGAVWQLFLDENKLPASPPPWGKIVAIDINSGKINWSIPFGYRSISSSKKIKGDINFGGVLSTRGNIFFATGTPDEYARAYNSLNGEEIWKFKLPVAGSAPPMTYLHEDEQYVVFNASGGRFFGFSDQLGDYLIAFKLRKK